MNIISYQYETLLIHAIALIAFLFYKYIINKTIKIMINNYYNKKMYQRVVDNNQYSI